jgi:hypothetical protein
MSIRLFVSEAKFLERTRIALINARTHEEIKGMLADFGMDEEKLDSGWNTYEHANSMKELSDRESRESSLASMAYQKSLDEFQALFKRHRDFARIFFKDEPEVLVTLGVRGEFPESYRDLFAKSKAFYQAIQDDSALQDRLVTIKITPEAVADAIAKRDYLLSVRAKFDSEMGESQQATQSKNAALLQLKAWMDKFDAIAKIALYDKPQLLEVLGIFVRS